MEHRRSAGLTCFAALAMAATVMVGCGGGDEDQPAAATPESVTTNLEAAGYGVEEKAPVADAGVKVKPADTLTISLQEADTGLAELDFYAEPGDAEAAYAENSKLDDKRFATEVRDTRVYVCNCINIGDDLDAQAILGPIVDAAEGG